MRIHESQDIKTIRTWWNKQRRCGLSYEYITKICRYPTHSTSL